MKQKRKTVVLNEVSFRLLQESLRSEKELRGYFDKFVLIQIKK